MHFAPAPNAGTIAGMVAEQPSLLEQIRLTVSADLAAADGMIRQELTSDVALVNQVSDYIIGAGGKRLRPLICLLAARAVGLAPVDHQVAGDIAVIGIDDAISEAVARESIAAGGATVIPISGRQSLQRGVFVQNGLLTNALDAQHRTADLRTIKSLQGEHNGQNAAAAYAACVAYGCEHDAIIAAMHNYVGLPHRMQWLGEVNGVQFVNDSKATNADAAEKSLRTYDNIFWIAGGVAKEGGIESLGAYFPKIRHAFLIGDASAMFAKTLDGHVSYTQCGTLENAFHTAAKQAAASGGSVVLAPACASFDQFANFEKRGEAFAQLVRDYTAQQHKDSHAATA